jgi:hypothetical protein
MGGINMKSKDTWASLLQRVNTYSTAIYSGGFFLLGCLLIWIGTGDEWWQSKRFLWMDGPNLKCVIHDIGSLLVASVPLALFWDLFVRRKFLDEILAKAHLAKEVEDAGVLHIFRSFQQLGDWTAFFTGTLHLDIFFYSGHSWRSNNHEHLRSFLQKSHSRLRVVLPDPDDPQLVTQLSKQFGYLSEKIQADIIEAKDDFVGLASGGAGSVEIYYFREMSPHTSFYRFDNITIFALYNHDKERSPVPAFVIGNKGHLQDYFRHEFDVIVKRARQVFPVPAEQLERKS